jgi:hypothetical protein
MGETAEERRLRQLRLIVSPQWIRQYSELTNPCAEIVLTSSQRCALGDKPLVKFTKFKFNF